MNSEHYFLTVFCTFNSCKVRNGRVFELIECLFTKVNNRQIYFGCALTNYHRCLFGSYCAKHILGFVFEVLNFHNIMGYKKPAFSIYINN